MKERIVKETSDGSKTLFINELNESYHSGHGAMQEAEHVFIKNGLNNIKNYDVNILELGFGTGLNVLVTIDAYLKTDKNHTIHYYTVEKYPVLPQEIAALNYPSLFDNGDFEKFSDVIHTSPWQSKTEILPGFFLTKFETDFYQIGDLPLPGIDLVYYDCFGARVQPDLWETPMLSIVAETMKIGGLLTTYASKGSLRRNLQHLGFEVIKKDGPPGKREMINAVKKSLDDK